MSKIQQPKTISNHFWYLVPILVLLLICNSILVSALVRFEQGTVLAFLLDKFNQPLFSDLAQKFSKNGIKVFGQVRLDLKNPENCRNVWTKIEDQNLVQLFLGNNFKYKSIISTPLTENLNINFDYKGENKLDLKTFNSISTEELDIKYNSFDQNISQIKIGLNTFENPESVLIKPQVESKGFPSQEVKLNFGLNNFSDLSDLNLNEILALADTNKNLPSDLDLKTEQNIQSVQSFYDTFIKSQNIKYIIQTSILTTNLNQLMSASTGQDLLEFACSNIENIEMGQMLSQNTEDGKKLLRPLRLQFKSDLEAKWKEALPKLSYELLNDKVTRQFGWNLIEKITPKLTDIFISLMNFSLVNVQQNLRSSYRLQTEENLLNDDSLDSLPSFNTLESGSQKAPALDICLEIANYKNSKYLKDSVIDEKNFQEFFGKYIKYQPNAPKDISNFPEFASYFFDKYTTCQNNNIKIVRSKVSEDFILARDNYKQEFFNYEITKETNERFFSDLFTNKTVENQDEKVKNIMSSFKTQVTLWYDYDQGQIYSISALLQASSINLNDSKLIPDGEIPNSAKTQVNASIELYNLGSYNPDLSVEKPSSQSATELVKYFYKQFNS